MNVVSFLLLTLILSCGHSIHMVQANGFDLSREKLGKFKVTPIESRSEKLVVLGFAFDTNYVNRARKNLENKCPKGRIEGITIQFSTSLGFYSWKDKILIKGLCVSPLRSRAILPPDKDT